MIPARTPLFTDDIGTSLFLNPPSSDKYRNYSGQAGIVQFTEVCLGKKDLWLALDFLPSIFISFLKYGSCLGES